MSEQIDRKALAELIGKAVDSACSYAASDGDRMAHVIGYLCGHADVMPGPIFERLSSAVSPSKE